MAWVERIAEKELESRLRRSGGVLIEGAKAVGKTALARRVAASEVMFDRDVAMRQAAAIDPQLVLSGDAPRLLDEYQLVENLWNAVRAEIDDRGTKGQFILTGSATPEDHKPAYGRSHTGARRITPLRLRTLSLYEIRRPEETLSLSALFDGKISALPSERITVSEIAEHICRGGWPDSYDLDLADAQELNLDYLQTVAQIDIQRVDGVRRDPIRVLRFLRSWARNTATTASVASLSRVGDDELAAATAHSYHDALQRLLVVENQPAWSPALRSKTHVVALPKRHLEDPSLAVAALATSPKQLLSSEIKTLGFLFESQVTHDLRVLAQPFRGAVAHYRDSSGMEVDSIVTVPDGSWIGVEVKLGRAQIDHAAESLLKLKAQVDSDFETCKALLVVTADSPTYQRPDGVIVTSLAALGP